MSYQAYPKLTHFNFFNLREIKLFLGGINYASKVMLKILQPRIQQYMSQELPEVQTGFRKGRGTRDQIANICWIIIKAIEFQKDIYFFFIDYARTLTMWTQQTV